MAAMQGAMRSLLEVAAATTGSNGTTTPKKAGGSISSGIFVAGSDPLEHPVGLLFLQILIILCITRLLAVFLRPLRQPRVIAEIIGGILLGPSVLGRIPAFARTVFPTSSISILETLATLGISFYLFLVGMELDLGALRSTGKAALSISAVGFILPFGLAAGVAQMIDSLNLQPEGIGFGYLFLFTGVAMGVTAFPVLARILAELRLLTDNVGRIAMGAAALADVVAWILLALTVAIVQGRDSPIIVLWIMLTSLAFVGVMWFLVKPVFDYVASRFQDRESVSEFSVVLAFFLVIASALCTEVIGIHPIFGGFVAGAIIRHDSVYAVALVEKVEDFATGLFLPLYFAASGLKTNVGTINSGSAVAVMVVLILGAVVGKVVGCLGAALACKIPFRNSLTLGVLMSTKGLVELIVLNVGLQSGVLNEQLFSIYVVMALVTTFITTPLVVSIYPPARRFGAVSHVVGRNLASLGVDSPFKLLLTIWTSKDVPATITLLEMTRPGPGKDESRSQLKVQAIHVTELSERSSAIISIQRRVKLLGPAVGLNPVGLAFKTYSDLESSLPVRTSVVIAPSHSMHQDISTSALKAKAEVILLPYRKVAGGDTSTGNTLQVAHQVLKDPPCSVALLIDRGLAPKPRGQDSPLTSKNSGHSILVLFFGGADDREALVLAGRMARNPGNSMRVIHFVDEAVSRGVAVMADLAKEAARDDAALARFLASIKQEDAEGETPNATIDDVIVSSQPLAQAVEIASEGQFDLVIAGRNVRSYPDILMEDATRAVAGLSKRGGLLKPASLSRLTTWSEKSSVSLVSPAQDGSIDLTNEANGSSAAEAALPLATAAERVAFGPVAEALINNPACERQSLLIIQSYNSTQSSGLSSPPVTLPSSPQALPPAPPASAV